MEPILNKASWNVHQFCSSQPCSNVLAVLYMFVLLVPAQLFKYVRSNLTLLHCDVGSEAIYMYACCVYLCVCACVCACMRVCVYVYMCVDGG